MTQHNLNCSEKNEELVEVCLHMHMSLCEVWASAHHSFVLQQELITLELKGAVQLCQVVRLGLMLTHFAVVQIGQTLLTGASPCA